MCGSAVDERLYVSDAFHDVKIEVTEDGTKAAATTGKGKGAFSRYQFDNERQWWMTTMLSTCAR